jgi:beta-glucuronidase
MRLSKILILAAAVLGMSAGPAAAQSAVSTPSDKTLYRNGPSGRFLMDGPWLFRFDNRQSGPQRDTGTGGWRRVTVPNAWNATDESDASFGGAVGWYRKDFRLPSNDRAGSWVVRFESVNYRAKVWLNGELVGEHEGAYVPWEVPTLGLTRTGVNRLVIRVDNRRGRSDVPKGGDRANGRPGGGWWNYGGLLREVYLRSFEGVDVEAVRVRAELGPTQERARLRFRVQLDNPSDRDVRFRLRTTVGDIEHETPPRVIGSGGRRALFFTVNVPEPRLWMPKAPELYNVGVTAMRGRRALSGYRLKFGIREIRVSDDGLLLINGRRARLFGASIHEDHPVRGGALSPADRRRDMRLIRDLGAGIIRSHYPLHPHYLEMADRMGVMVWDQVPVYSQGYKGFAVPGVTEKSLAYVRAMVARDQNHPSVLAWSIANELSARMTEDQVDYIRRAARLLDRIDPTRLRTIDIFGWPQNPPADVYHRLDAVGINNYFGWYPGPNGQSEDKDRLGPFLDQMREYYPELALFVTEFGAESNREGPADRKGTYAFQQELLRHHIETYRRKSYLNGAVAWILRDFRVRPDWEGGNPTPEPPWNQKGLADELGRKKPAFAPTAALYKSIPAVGRRFYRRARR